MIALFYLLGFLTGIAANIVRMLISSAKKKNDTDSIESDFREILNY